MPDPLTLEQQRAIAAAQARLRAQGGTAAAPVQAPTSQTQQLTQQAQQNQGAHPDTYRPGGSVGGVARSLGTGIVEGVTDPMMDPLQGTFGWLEPAYYWALNKGSDWFGDGRDFEPPADPYQADPIGRTMAGVQEQRDAGLHQPNGIIEEYARTVGQFIPGAVMSPGGPVGNALRYGVLPGLLSETAGQMTEGTGAEPFARVVGAILGGGAGSLTHPVGAAAAGLDAGAGASQILARELRGSGLTDDTAAQAVALMERGRENGIPLTLPEALSQVTNGQIDLTMIQRMVERVGGGRSVMADVMAQRAPGATAAVAREADALGPLVSPAALGPEMMRMADTVLSRTRREINDATRGNYLRADGMAIDPDAFGALYEDPVFRRALREVMEQPEYARYVEGATGPDSIQVLDAVKKRLDDMAASAQNDRTMWVSDTYSQTSNAVRDAATAASPDYATALSTQADLRRNVLDPMQAGPIGLIAGTDDLATQVQGAFPRAPFPGSDYDLGNAVGQLSQQSPEMAQAFIRSHVQQTFDEATRALQSGPNQFGGAGFVKGLLGNPQQRQNLRSAVLSAFPDGETRWQGFEQLIEVLEATGRRLSRGSDTSFNTRFMEGAQGGGVLGNLVSNAASPGRAATLVGDFVANLRFGRNTAELARILTDPNSAAALARLANGGPINDLLPTVVQVLGQSNQLLARDSREANAGFSQPTLGRLIPPMPQ